MRASPDKHQHTLVTIGDRLVVGLNHNRQSASPIGRALGNRGREGGERGEGREREGGERGKRIKLISKSHKEVIFCNLLNEMEWAMEFFANISYVKLQ